MLWSLKVLFRGITPHSPDYGFASLIPDVCSLIDLEVQDASNAFSKLGIPEGTRSAMQNDFRGTSSDYFLYARSNALHALKEGITLDGRLATILFQLSDILLIAI